MAQSQIHREVLEANRNYAENFGDKGNLALPPARGFVILTCMDARLDPTKYAGLSEGDAHVIRNAGGRASDDAIRSQAPRHARMVRDSSHRLRHGTFRRRHHRQSALR